MQTAEPGELAHANTALFLGLVDVLATKGVLTRSDLNTVITDAISKLESSRQVRSNAGAIEFIKSLFPDIHDPN